MNPPINYYREQSKSDGKPKTNVTRPMPFDVMEAYHNQVSTLSFNFLLLLCGNTMSTHVHIIINIRSNNFF